MPEVNPRTYLITDEKELDPQWIAGAGSIGICGATSTPRWLMQRVAQACAELDGKGGDA